LRERHRRVVSTAVGGLGRAAPTALLIGDVALLHDTNGLLGLARRGVDLLIVVVDNDGGGIFSFLPQATAVAADTFEQLYGTPHGVDLVALTGPHGLVATEIAAARDLGPAIEQAVSAGGVQVPGGPHRRATNVVVHDEAARGGRRRISP
jgi:2-succinyl-5-enolpyruvyl-6-hydroxy-3-cyclohexene-1-carboxylate synthase